MSTLERAIVIAAEGHAGVKDKGGAPYILHPLRMMLALSSPDERIVAVLHDVCEDCPAWTLDRLRAEGFAHHIITALDSVTKREGEDYETFVRARKGQGLFKERVGKIETKCRITGVENPVPLVASHCKPWRVSTNEERLDGENGLLITPSVDHLFDRGFIGFENNGALIISPVAHRLSLQRMGIDTTATVNVGTFTSGQKQFLEFHRNAVLLQSIR